MLVVRLPPTLVKAFLEGMYMFDEAEDDIPDCFSYVGGALILQQKVKEAAIIYADKKENDNGRRIFQKKQKDKKRQADAKRMPANKAVVSAPSDGISYCTLLTQRSVTVANASKENVQQFVKKVVEGKSAIGLDTEGNLPGSISVRPSLKVLFS